MSRRPADENPRDLAEGAKAKAIAEAKARFATAYAALHASHVVADHIVQSDRDAQLKGHPGIEGHTACARHVVSYTLTQALALTAADRVAGTRMRPGRILAGLAVSAVSHYVIDRREPLRRFAAATGHAGFHDLGKPRPGRDDNPCLGTGAYALDQSAHTFFLLLAALIIGGGKR